MGKNYLNEYKLSYKTKWKNGIKTYFNANLEEFQGI